MCISREHRQDFYRRLEEENAKDFLVNIFIFGMTNPLYPQFLKRLREEEAKRRWKRGRLSECKELCIGYVNTHLHGDEKCQNEE